MQLDLRGAVAPACLPAAETSHSEASHWFIEVIYLDVTGEQRNRGYLVASP